jgi:hypothetical protein
VALPRSPGSLGPPTHTPLIPLPPPLLRQTTSKISVYITSGVDGVGALPPANVHCAFTTRGLDLVILGLKGRDLRLLRTNLAGDIVGGSLCTHTRVCG